MADQGREQRAASEGELFRLLVENVVDYAIFVVDPEGLVQTWSHGAERLLGYREKEIVGRTADCFYTPEDIRDQVPQRERREALATGRGDDDRWHVRKDGTRLWVSGVLTPLRDEGGSLRGFAKIMRDRTEWRHAEQARLEGEGRFRTAFAHAAVGMAVMDVEGRFLEANPAYCRITGYTSDELLRKDFASITHPDDLPKKRESIRRMLDGGVPGFVIEKRYVRKDGGVVWVKNSVSLVRDDRGWPLRIIALTEDITHRMEAEEAVAEQVRLAEYGRDVGRALTQGGTAEEVLARCAGATVRHLDGAFARIWTADEDAEVLHLRASAGMYTHTDGPHARIPVGRYKIGLIAQERRPHLTNSVLGDPRIPAQDWAKAEGMVAFAGYPLVVEGRLAGVLAMFARHELSDATLQAMASVADEIALGIERMRAEERLHRQREWLRVTLASIGDAVIATDTDGRVTFLNGVAEALTGWGREHAEGRPLQEVFRIVNEHTRREVESPAVRALREGAVVGLANHTVLIAREGTERAIDDSAAPIRDESGAVIGAVLIFRDVEERRRAERELGASEARKAAILDTALDAIITMDGGGNVVDWNPAAEATFGHGRAEALGRELAGLIIPPALREAHRRGLARHHATGEGPVLGRRIEITAVRSDGSEFPVELAVARIPGDGPALFTAHIRDISGRKAIERRRNARLAVTEVLAGAATPGEAAAEVLRAVCEGLGWDVGAMWTLDEGSGVLRCLDLWRRPSASVGRFEAASRGRTYEPGVGLPGRVWGSGRPAWIPDVTVEANFPRGPIAAEEGLHGAFAAPISAGEEFLGVVEFYSGEVREPDPDLLEMMATLGGQVGQFLERRRAEERLRRSERELADFFENATVGLHWVGPDGTILRANRAELDLLGYSEGEYVGRHIAEFHADEEVICDILRRLQAGEELHDCPARLRCKDGSIKDVLIDSNVMREGGEFVHTRCFTRDVTGRKRAEEGLREQTRIAEALNRIGVLLAAELDLERLVQVVTDEATRLTDARFGAFFYNVPDEKGGAYTLYTISGVPREAFSRFPMPRATDLFGPTFRNEGVVRLDDVTQDPRFGRNAPHHGMPEGHLPVRSYLAVSVVSRTGEVLGGLFFGHPEPGIFDEADERLVVGIAAQASVAIDNARLYRELRAAKEDADAANRAKTQFLAVLSHELRTPLNPILLAASSMLERPAEPGEIRPTLEMIRQNVNLQARLIDDLLDVMRIVRGKMPLHWEVADCHGLIRQSLQMCESDVFGKELRLELDLAAQEHFLNADPARFQQVIWNLVKNAVKFTPGGGVITIRTLNPEGEGGGHLVVEVADTGIGIEPEILPLIFDPFQQGETQVTRKFGGLGLGLAICRGIVEAHGGTLVAESCGTGRGATFRVVLKTIPSPAGTDAEPAGTTGGNAAMSPSSHRILVVEDEPATLRLMARLLRGLGHAVTTAGTIASGYEAFEAGEFDLIVSDIGLPDGTGLELMRRVVALRGKIPAIALTGYGMEDDIVRSRQAGFTAHMTKPIDFTKLEAMIRQVTPNPP